MAYGIELTNGNGKTVIGIAHKNLTFQEKLTGTAGTHALSGTVESNVITTFVTTLTDNANRPVVYFVPDQDYSTPYKKDHKGYMPVNIYYSGGVWRIDVASDGEHSSSVTLYVFTSLGSATSGWGLQTFNIDGSLAFDGGQQPLVLTGTLTLNRGSDAHTSDSSGSWWQTIGSDTATIPGAAQKPKLAIAAGPFFYGSDGVTAISENQVSNSYFLGGIKRSSATELGTFWGFMGAIASFTGVAISAPLWSDKDVSIIDGAMYD